MTILVPAKAGDVRDVRTIRLDDKVGDTTTPFDLTNASSVRALVRLKGTKAVLAGAVTDAVGGIVEIQLGIAPTDWLPARPKAGDWQFEVEVTFNDGTILTWPAYGYDTLEVFYDLD